MGKDTKTRIQRKMYRSNAAADLWFNHWDVLSALPRWTWKVPSPINKSWHMKYDAVREWLKSHVQAAGTPQYPYQFSLVGPLAGHIHAENLRCNQVGRLLSL